MIRPSLRRALTLALVLLGAPSPVRAQCGSVASYASQIFERYLEEAREAGCLLTNPVWGARKFIACQVGRPANQLLLYDRMVGWWNAAEWNDGWATLGPRRLSKDWQTGTLLFTTGRLWLSTVPENTGAATIEVEKLDGTAPAEVTICATTEDGTTRRLGGHRFEGGKGTVGDVLDGFMVGIENAVISVYLDATGWNPFSTFHYRVRYEAEPRTNDLDPVKGFADLHVHQAAELGFGGNNLWGSHFGPPSEALPPDGLENTVEESVLQGPVAWVLGLHSLPGLALQMGEEGVTRHGPGYPTFERWPHFDDVTHQQVHEDWLKEAHEEGLRLVVVSAVNFEGFCFALKAMYPRPGDRMGCRDMENVRRQIEALHRMDEERDWYEIVVDPWHARHAITEGRLAVVLSFEASHLLPADEGRYLDQLDKLWGMGVRTFQIAHETDSRFAGAAPHRWPFAVFQFFKWLPHARVSLTDGFKVDARGKNVEGLSGRGRTLIEAMIDRYMLLDVAHLSERSVRDLHDLVARRHDYYPLYDSHTRFEWLLSATDRRVQKEFLTTEEQIRFIRETGGMVGLRTGQNDLRPADASAGVANDCAGSSRSYAQMVHYARKARLQVAVGSDLNGFINQLGPRFGDEACPTALDTEREDQRAAQTGTPIGYCQSVAAERGRGDFGFDGLRHVGYLPDLVSDLEALGTPGVEELKSSAEAFLRMWERAYDLDRSRVPDGRDLAAETAGDVGPWALCGEVEDEGGGDRTAFAVRRSAVTGGERAEEEFFRITVSGPQVPDQTFDVAVAELRLHLFGDNGRIVYAAREGERATSPDGSEIMSMSVAFGEAPGISLVEGSGSPGQMRIQVAAATPSPTCPLSHGCRGIGLKPGSGSVVVTEMELGDVAWDPDREGPNRVAGTFDVSLERTTIGHEEQTYRVRGEFRLVKE